jgi:hypothetical protein
MGLTCDYSDRNDEFIGPTVTVGGEKGFGKGWDEVREDGGQE